jgi:hypothetical protein
MIDQKKRSKKYRYLHKAKVDLWIGRVSTGFKGIYHGMFLTEEDAIKAKAIMIVKDTVTIGHTFYNGKNLYLYAEPDYQYSHLGFLVIPNDKIENFLKNVTHENQTQK